MKTKLFFILSFLFASMHLAAVNVTFQVDMSREKNVGAVSIAGDFQSKPWDPNANVMTKSTGNIYTITLPLVAAASINYRFIINGGNWEQPVGACASGLNRKLTVPSTDITLPVECFNNCGVCSTAPAKNVTIQVDMTGRTVAPEGVHIAGNFQNWDPTTTALTHTSGNIYSVTIPFFTGSSGVEYKFINGNGWAGQETVSGTCLKSGTTNRYFVPPVADSVIKPVCFGSCFSCGSTVNVTFKVDMSHVLSGVSPNGVHVTGDFQGWSPSTTALATTGAGIYTVTVPLVPGSTFNYKFMNGNAWGTEEIVFGKCAFRTNRSFTVPKIDTVFAAVCFGYCDAGCTPVSGTRVACIGNSITAGAGVIDPKTQGYPAQLQNQLGANFWVENFGHSGSTLLKNGDLPYVSVSEFIASKALNPNIVVIKLGTNDSKSFNWGPYGAQYVADYEAMIDVYKALPSKPKIYVCFPAKAFSTAYGIDENVLATKIRPAIVKVSKDKGVSLIDLYDATMNLSSYFPDGIHPNEVGSGAIATKIDQILTANLPQISASQVNPVKLTTAAAYGYQWYFNNDTIAAVLGGNQKELSATKEGYYKVLVKVNATNEDRLLSATFVVGNPTGLNHLNAADLNVLENHPNPASSYTEFSYEVKESGFVSLKIMDLLGNIVAEPVNEMKIAGNYSVLVNLDKLSDGLYTYRLVCNGASQTKKMQIIK